MKKRAKKRQTQKRHNATPKTALMRIPAPPAQPWNLTLDEVALVKNHIAKNATDKELEFCLAVARRHKLDPFRGQIWFVKRKDQTAEGGYRWIPITGINGMLHIAARDHKDFGSNDEPEFGPMHEVKWTYFQSSGKIQAPEWARVKLWKKGHDHPIVATVFWEEIYPDVGAAPLVRQMPRLMLGKCALAQAVRRAYPATDGLYIKEEFQGPPEFTPGGRVMTIEPPRENDCTFCGKKSAPDGCPEPLCPIRKDKGYLKLTSAQKEIVDRQISQAAKSSQEEGPAKVAGAAGAVGPRNPPTPPTAPVAKPTITYVWFDRSSTARIDTPTFELQADMKAIFRKLVRQGHVAPNADELDALRFECEKRGIELKRRYETREPGE